MTTHGGKRPGAGLKPGQKKKKRKPAALKRVSMHLSLPKWMADRLRQEIAGGGYSGYICELILNDNPEWKPGEGEG